MRSFVLSLIISSLLSQSVFANADIERPEISYEELQRVIERSKTNRQKLIKARDQRLANTQRDLMALKTYISSQQDDVVILRPEVNTLDENHFTPEIRDFFINTSSDANSVANLVLAIVNASIAVTMFKRRGPVEVIKYGLPSSLLAYYFGTEVALATQEAKLLKDVVITIENVLYGEEFSKKIPKGKTYQTIDDLKKIQVLRKRLDAAIENRHRNQEKALVLVPVVSIITLLNILQSNRIYFKRFAVSILTLLASYVNNDHTFKQEIIDKIDVIIDEINELRTIVFIDDVVF